MRRSVKRKISHELFLHTIWFYIDIAGGENKLCIISGTTMNYSSEFQSAFISHFHYSLKDINISFLLVKTTLLDFFSPTVTTSYPKVLDTQIRVYRYHQFELFIESYH